MGHAFSRNTDGVGPFQGIDHLYQVRGDKDIVAVDGKEGLPLQGVVTRDVESISVLSDPVRDRLQLVPGLKMTAVEMKKHQHPSSIDDQHYLRRGRDGTFLLDSPTPETPWTTRLCVMIKTTSLGSTGLQVTRIGLGMAALGRPGYINLGHKADLTGRTEVRALEEHAHEVLTAAYDLGIRSFDTARSYGGGEEFLGRWLYNTRTSDPALTISSKWGYRYVADWRVDAEVHEVKEHSLACLDTQYEETRARLGRHIDLYQIHSATLESGVLDDDQVLDRLAEIKQDGLAIGLSTSGPNQSAVIRKAMTIEREGTLLFQTVQSTWNLLETSAGTALAEAHDAGMGTIIKESVANGRLTERDRATTAPIRDAFPDHAPDTIAVAAILAQPWVDMVLSGAATTEQLVSNLAALDIAPDQLDDLPPLAEAPQDYWQTRSDLKWT